MYFNPRAPCGARPAVMDCICIISLNFNPRAPCGARLVPRLFPLYHSEFQSTRPVRARLKTGIFSTFGDIFQSTRPVRGATKIFWIVCARMSNFNPRAPCGARPPPKTKEEKPCTFQSTRPVRGATIKVPSVYSARLFQSTRPVRGATGLRHRFWVAAW